MSESKSLTKTSSPTRRDFCLHTSRLVSGATLGSLAAACSGGGNPAAPSGSGGGAGSGSTLLQTLNGTVVGNQVNVTVAADSPLASDGGSALVASAIGTFLATRGGNAFTVVTATCTHEQCTINAKAGGTFVCPCHQSRFTTGGAVVNGPAGLPLTSFVSQFDGATLAITT